uniref:Uncharacterized protein n=1 Tax=Populus trichocarpa TaxID=3694 RepID=U5GTI8_POPTR
MCNVHLRKIHDPKPQRHSTSFFTVAAEFWLLQLNFAEITRSQFRCDTYLHDAGFESKVEILVACKVAKCSVQESE